MNSDFDLSAFRGRMCSLGAGDMRGDGGGEPSGIIAASKYDVQSVDIRYREGHRAYTLPNFTHDAIILERDVDEGTFDEVPNCIRNGARLLINSSGPIEARVLSCSYSSANTL